MVLLLEFIKKLYTSPANVEVKEHVMEILQMSLTFILLKYLQHPSDYIFVQFPVQDLTSIVALILVVNK